MATRIGAAVVSALAVIGVLIAIAALRAEDHGTAPEAGRTVLVAAGDVRLPATPFYALRDCLGNPNTCVNGAGGIVLTYVVGGETPRHGTTATVLTDENCEPDQHGVSHCLNRLRLDAGGMVTVRHDHHMGNDPCLAPGERVQVEPLDV